MVSLYFFVLLIHESPVMDWLFIAAIKYEKTGKN